MLGLDVYDLQSIGSLVLGALVVWLIMRFWKVIFWILVLVCAFILISGLQPEMIFGYEDFWDEPSVGDYFGVSPEVDFGEPGVPGESLVHDERSEMRSIAPPPVISEQSLPVASDPVERWWD